MRRKTGAACKGKHDDRTSLPHNLVFREGQPVQVCSILTDASQASVLNVAEQNKMSAAACKLTSVVRPETQHFLFSPPISYCMYYYYYYLYQQPHRTYFVPAKKPQECTSTSARQRHKYCCQKFYRHT